MSTSRQHRDQLGQTRLLLKDWLDPMTSSQSHKWKDSALEVTARLIPRFVWMTASIDVVLNGQPILRSGGEMRITGSAVSEFDYRGSVHRCELSWGQYR